MATRSKTWKDPARFPDVRFFKAIAKEHSIHESALVYAVFVWSNPNEDGFDPGSNEVYNTTQDWARVLGVCERQLRRIVASAVKHGWLLNRQGRNRIYLSIASKERVKQLNKWTYEEENAQRENEVQIFDYNRETAKALGPIRAIIYELIKYYTDNSEGDEQGWRSGYARFVMKFPFFKITGVRRALQHLRDMGLIVWDTHHCAHARGGWRFMTTSKALPPSRAKGLSYGTTQGSACVANDTKSTPDETSYPLAETIRPLDETISGQRQLQLLNPRSRVVLSIRECDST